MSNDIVFGTDAKNAIVRGVEKLAKAVKSTLGPSGKNVIISRKGLPLITKDGVTVAKSIFLKDELEKLGAAMVQEVASKTNDTAGDGTTTATILAEAIFKEGLKLISAGNNPIEIKRQMDSMVKIVIEKLKELSKKVDTPEEVKNIAKISTNGDEELGNLIAEAINKVGEKGTVLVENSPTSEDNLKYIEGFQLERSYLSSSFITDHAKFEVVYDNPRYLIIEDKLDNIKDILNILEYCAKNNNPLIIAVDDIEDTLLAALAVNRLKAGLKIAVINTPGFGDNKHEAIKDFALKVDATIFNKDAHPLRNFTPNDLGESKKIIININETLIIEGIGNVEEHIENLQESLNSLESQMLKDRIQQRINLLNNSIAVIQLGAVSETELKDKKLRVEDALNATKAAIAEGIVPGGGIALFRVKEKIDNKNVPVGGQVILNILDTPIRAILNNIGINAEKVIAQLEGKEDNYGYDGSTDTFGNLLDLGVVDPVKVTRNAIQNANSVAGMLLTTEVAIIKEDKNE